MDINKPTKTTIEETNEYERLVKFFVTNQLEFDGDEEVDTDIVSCYKIEDSQNKNDGQEGLIGGAVLAKREGRFICDGIAVNPDSRDKGIGKDLLDVLINKVKELNGDSLFLVARAPKFFGKYGFVEVNPKEAPNFFECKYCPQYQKTCFPKIMKYEIN